MLRTMNTLGRMLLLVLALLQSTWIIASPLQNIESESGTDSNISPSNDPSLVFENLVNNRFRELQKTYGTDLLMSEVYGSCLPDGPQDQNPAHFVEVFITAWIPSEKKLVYTNNYAHESMHDWTKPMISEPVEQLRVFPWFAKRRILKQVLHDMQIEKIYRPWTRFSMGRLPDTAEWVYPDEEYYRFRSEDNKHHLYYGATYGQFYDKPDPPEPNGSNSTFGPIAPGGNSSNVETS